MSSSKFSQSGNRQNELSNHASIFDADVKLEDHTLFEDYHDNKLDVNTMLIDIDSLISAPDEWNQWTKLSRVQMFELINSIEEIGLQHNIVVWKNREEKYIILSGHNRVQAYRELYKMTKDEKYLKIRSLISDSPNMTEEIAKKIIDDTNVIGRNVSPSERARAVMKRYAELSDEASKVSEKKLLTLIGSEENKDYKQIKRLYDLNKLIPEIQLLIGNKLSIKAGQKLAMFDAITQEHIYNEYYLKSNEFFSNRTIEKLKKYMNIVSIEKIFTNNYGVDESSFIEIKIPPEIKNDVLKMIKVWQEENLI